MGYFHKLVLSQTFLQDTPVIDIRVFKMRYSSTHDIRPCLFNYIYIFIYIYNNRDVLSTLCARIDVITPLPMLKGCMDIFRVVHQLLLLPL